MNCEFLKRLYRACSPDTAVDPNGPSGLFNSLPGTDAAHKRFAERLAQARLPAEVLGVLEDLAAEECLAYEEQGFIYVLDFLESKGYRVDTAEIDSAIEAAVLKLHEEMKHGN